MVINTNIAALSSARSLGESSGLLARSLSRLSSGNKIVSPADDSAGLAVSMRFDAQVNRAQAAMNNLGNAMSFSQTQDGSLKKIGRALDRMSALAMLAMDATKSDVDRELYDHEFQALGDYVNGEVTRDFNGVSLFGGGQLQVINDSEGDLFTMSGIQGDYLATAVPPTGPTFPDLTTTLGALLPGFTSATIEFRHIGPGFSSVPASFSASSTLGALVGTLNGLAPGAGSASYNSSNGQLTLSVVNDGHATDGFFDQSPSSGLLDDLGFGNSVAATPATGSNSETATLSLTSSGSLTSPLDITTIGRAASTLKRVKSALSRLATDRATVGANMASLGFSIDQLGTLKDNLSAANSRIRDVDVADESTRFSRFQILMQAGTALLAQANSTPQSILRLLQ